MQATRVHEGAVLAYDTVPDPEPSPARRPSALARMESGERFGKLVLTIG